VERRTLHFRRSVIHHGDANDLTYMEQWNGVIEAIIEALQRMENVSYPS
jgi:hypothetical protein